MNIRSLPFRNIVLIIFVIAAAGYIAFDVFSKVRIELLSQGYSLGVRDAVSEIIRQTENAGCNPFPVFLEDTQVRLVNADCIEPAQEN